MTTADARTLELRVLVLAPIGRDREVTCAVLRDAGFDCAPCAGVDDLRRECALGVGAILATAEALGPRDAAAMAELLSSQPPWSDVPVVLAVGGRDTAEDVRRWAGDALGRPGAVTVLERPIRRLTLTTVVRSVLSARQRQYDMRDLLARYRTNVERLDGEKVVRERFVSLLAHDLRGPLSTATMTATLIAARPERLEDRRDLAERILRSLQRADRMIQDLLDANRLRAGHRLSLDLQVCDLPEITHDVIADLGDAERQRVAVVAPVRLEGVWSHDQLRRALWNLVTNALKYGASGATVEVEIGQHGEVAVVRVHNAGIAIPLDEQARLFEPFGRTLASESRARGWGLGLTLVRGCAEAHGGSVQLSSTPDAGTTFTMKLPLDARPFQPAGDHR